MAGAPNRPAGVNRTRDGPRTTRGDSRAGTRGRPVCALARPAQGPVGPDRRPAALVESPYRRHLIRAVAAGRRRTRVEHPLRWPPASGSVWDCGDAVIGDQPRETPVCRFAGRCIRAVARRALWLRARSGESSTVWRAARAVRWRTSSSRSIRWQLRRRAVRAGAGCDAGSRRMEGIAAVRAECVGAARRVRASRACGAWLGDSVRSSTWTPREGSARRRSPRRRRA